MRGDRMRNRSYDPRVNMTHTTRRGGSRLPIIVGIIVTAIVLWMVAWNNGVGKMFEPKRFGVVEEGAVYRVSKLTPPTMRKLVRELELKTIIDFGAYDEGSVEDLALARQAEELGVKRIRLPLSGHGTGNPNAYAKALQLMADESNHPIMIGCGAGTERTGACVMLYRRFTDDKPFSESGFEAIDAGHDPSRNPRMYLYLADWGDAIIEAARTNVAVEGFRTHGLPEAAGSTTGDVYATSESAPLRVELPDAGAGDAGDVEPNATPRNPLGLNPDE